MTEWHFLVDRADYRNTRVIEAHPADVQDGQIRVRVDAFGFTANNVTYAAGDMIGYWKFFPAPDTDDGVDWGRVPVGGSATSSSRTRTSCWAATVCSATSPCRPSW